LCIEARILVVDSVHRSCVNCSAIRQLQLVWGFLDATFLPGIAVTARRLHDTDRSGWWQLLWLIPLVGWTDRVESANSRWIGSDPDPSDEL
jgi:uncharacterized membrane protein YhaH (DUF805 family)